jgi:hypothetical protein
VSHGNAPAVMTEMPWITWLDLDTGINEEGEIAVALARPKPEHLNHNNVINASVAFGVAEVAGLGAAVLGFLDLLPSTYTAVESASIAYTAPANRGLVATGRLERTAAEAARESVAAGAPVSISVSVTLADLAGRNAGAATFVVAVRPRRKSRRVSGEHQIEEDMP